MPNPSNYSNKKDFIAACIPIAMKEGKTQEQAAGMCYGMWDAAKTLATNINLNDIGGNNMNKIEKAKYLAELPEVMKARTVHGYESPEPGDLPEHQAKVLANVYASCRADGGDKEKCSKIAWATAKKATKSSCGKGVNVNRDQLRKSLNVAIKYCVTKIVGLTAEIMKDGYVNELPAVVKGSQYEGLYKSLSNERGVQMKSIYYLCRKDGLSPEKALAISADCIRKARAKVREVHTWADGSKHKKTDQGWVPVKGEGGQQGGGKQGVSRQDEKDEQTFEEIKKIPKHIGELSNIGAELEYKDPESITWNDVKNIGHAERMLNSITGFYGIKTEKEPNGTEAQMRYATHAYNVHAKNMNNKIKAIEKYINENHNKFTPEDKQRMEKILGDAKEYSKSILSAMNNKKGGQEDKKTEQPKVGERYKLSGVHTPRV